MVSTSSVAADELIVIDKDFGNVIDSVSNVFRHPLLAALAPCSSWLDITQEKRIVGLRVLGGQWSIDIIIPLRRSTTWWLPVDEEY